MITDSLLQLATAQAVTVSAPAINTIDAGPALRDYSGTDLILSITVDTTVAAAGAATVQFQVVSSANADLSASSVLGQTDTLAKSELVAGRRPIYVKVPRHTLLSQLYGKRYLGLNFNVGTGPLTAGAFSVAVVGNEQSIGANYASGWTVA